MDIDPLQTTLLTGEAHVQLERNEMLNWVIEVVTNCHHGKALPDCPVSEIRKFPAKERMSITTVRLFDFEFHVRH